MVRAALAFILALTLSACLGGAPDTSGSAPGNPADTRVAKTLFGAMQVASRQSPAPIGGYARGCQAGAVQLPETGPTWQAMRLSRNRNWGQPVLIDYIQDLSRHAASLPGWRGLYVGDMSQPRGGPMLTGHRSHQIGLDVDIWMRPADRLDLSRSARENISSISMRRAGGAYTNGNWSAQHMALLKRAAEDPRTARIFVFPGAKVAMCNAETGNHDYLRKIRPWWGHHYHFHIRLECPPGARGCEDQAPIPPGDGCAEAQGWVDRILNPPPPDPDAPRPAPRRELTMGDLPAACTAVLEAN